MKQRVREYGDPVKERERLRAMVRNLPAVDVGAACREIVASAHERIMAELPRGLKENPKAYSDRVERHRHCVTTLARIAAQVAARIPVVPVEH